MVQGGIKFCPEKKTLKAFLVYFGDDRNNKNELIKRQEELYVEESWVRDKFLEEDVQHIMNMRKTGSWNQVPRDLQIWIGKHRIVCLHYLPVRPRSVINFEALQEEYGNWTRQPKIFKKPAKQFDD